jgi:PAS domain S-box-containing protein
MAKETGAGARVVALGASAGGLQALRPIVDALEPHGHAAYIVAHHISPHLASSLPGILAAHARLAVEIAGDGVPILPDHIYVCPPGADVEVEDFVLRLRPPTAGALIAPSVDRLFQSVAACCGRNGVAVILSGSAHDGTLGARAIHEAGGLVLVQVPEEALQPGMPDSVITAGHADLVGSVHQIGDWLNRIDWIAEDRSPSPELAFDQAFAEVLALVRAATGLDVLQYKEGTLRRQTERRYRALGLASFAQYLDYVRTNADELQFLQQSFLISVSSFFRDAAIFDVLADALRPVLAAKRGGDPVRVWIPGCATGEEAYSIAIVIAELLGNRLADFDVRIFATDIDEEGIAFARAGLYPPAALAAVSAERRGRWFSTEAGGCRVSKEIRALCVFSVHDVIGNPPFIRMDLISCRNLLIYFKPEQQADLLGLFHYGLNPDGLLLLGRSESPGSQASWFGAVDAQHKLYRRRAGHATHPFRMGRTAATLRVTRPILARPDRVVQRQPLVEATKATIAREYGPPAVLVNASFEPVHFFGSAQRYFAIDGGSADFSAYALCLPELRSELKILCFRLVQEGSARVSGAPVDVLVAGETVRVRLVVMRVERQPPTEETAFVICFEEVAVRSGETAPQADGRAGQSAEIIQLRQELADTREHLQSVIEEFETSNEELQALNEEVQSSGEELQASNEELQASNEELTTVNDELRARSQEAVELTTTLGNIQNSIRAGLVVVDRDGRVVRFNPMAVRIFGLVDKDRGQFLFGVPCHLHLPNLREQVQSVVATGRSVVERVHQGEFHFLMQVDPYIDEYGGHAGAVLTFADISDLQRAEEAKEASEVRFRHVWEASIEGLTVVDDEGRIEMANPAIEGIFGYAPGELVGQPVESLVPERLRAHHRELREGFVRDATDGRVLARDLIGARKDGSEIYIEVSLSRMARSGRASTLASVNDISDRKKAEMALRDNAERLKLALDAAHAGTWVWHLDTNANFWTDEIWRLYGLEGTGAQPSFAAWRDTIVEADRERVLKAVADAAAAGAEFEVEWQVRCAPGDEPRWLLSRARPIVGANGRPSHYIGIVLDISRRKIAEIAMRESAERLKLALDAAHAGTWFWHLESNANVWSDEVWRLYGIASAGVEPSFEAWRESVVEADRERVLKVIGDAAAAGREFETEWQVRLPEGAAPRWLLSRGRPVLGADGRPSHYIGIVLDISQRKGMEIELKKHRDQLESLVAARTTELSELYNRAPCGYHTLNAKGEFVRVNDTELEWLGYTREEMLGGMRAFDLLAPHCRQVFTENFPKLMSVGEVRDLEADFVCKDGSFLPVLINARGFYDAQGRFQHSLSTVLDNRERKRAEAAWIAAREASELASRAKSAFLANMSHEIRTPLTAIIGMGELLRREQLTPRQADWLSKLDGAAQHLLLILTDVLDLAKIESGKFELDETPLDLETVVGEVVTMMGQRAHSKGLHLDVDVQTPACGLLGDTTRIRQALLNYVSNAVKFSERGTIHLRVREVADRGERILVRFEVADQGIGISTEALTRLFRNFEQADTSTTRQFGGTGLGLAIVKQMAVLMGGEAGAESSPGQGSVFWFTAELRKAPMTDAPVRTTATVAIPERAWPGKIVLVVDDDAVNREVALGMLESLDIAGETAVDGRDAVARAQARHYDLVLMDLHMPNMDGIAAAGRIRTLPGYADVPILALTGDAVTDVEARCLAGGMSGVMTKPFSRAQLIAAFTRWL